ncbi:signal recognition particle-docking protein FtsY [Sporolactobacillus terrae]|uniref:Signal recognition particle receptor FtsY n=1 Tax=Sporolactobacillus terrae TaxID=269673 RepID=A0A410D8D2_9BACL|nr:signal recognition particle-docking protein FtsY [Sporolactobacillus terrae]QAA22318.1 signal recognition particle-docking protein FtsY [Sporolactobacillus terrae]QAA25294.1 signal recognition particle-docking protein FtsY [Sporolactobacillus terrae]BBN98633.1 signal recognition particle receptor FtsY [Sporolactobacillus terrae]
MNFFNKMKDKLTGKSTAMNDKFKDGLTKTRKTFAERMNQLVKRYRKVDEDFFDELEEILIESDVGMNTVMDLVDRLKDESRARNIKDTDKLKDVIVEVLAEFLTKDNEETKLNMNPNGLTVILVVGVNGAGKTTTVGKLAGRLKNEGKHVLLAAADTFRAGAIEQLQVWGDRTGIDVIKHQEGSDPASVVYDAMQAAKSRKVDVLICDTAGRLQNKVNLMKELEKIKRVISRECPGAPHEVLLVLDATTGQNALSQAKLFRQASEVTGIALTKLDGTAKGGIVLAIRNEMDIPVKLVGLGEQLNDLQTFDADAFLYGLFSELFQNENEDTEDQ